MGNDAYRTAVLLVCQGLLFTAEDDPPKQFPLKRNIGFHKWILCLHGRGKTWYFTSKSPLCFGNFSILTGQKKFWKRNSEMTCTEFISYGMWMLGREHLSISCIYVYKAYTFFIVQIHSTLFFFFFSCILVRFPVVLL